MYVTSSDGCAIVLRCLHDCMMERVIRMFVLGFEGGKPYVSDSLTCVGVVFLLVEDVMSCVGMSGAVV